MTKHDAVNKLTVAMAHLRMADTLCTNSAVIDEIRKAILIIHGVGEGLGSDLINNKDIN